MNNTLILSVVVALLIGGIGGYAISHSKGNHGGHRSERMAGGRDQDDRTPNDKVTVPAMMGGDGNMGMMDHNMHGAMMVQSEQAFIEGMIPHHEEAVTTANEVLARGATTPEIRALAEGIVASQSKEITDMKAWYQAWYNKPYTATTTTAPMMRDLTTLSGAALDKAFLEDMIKHHMGALMMAHSVETHIEHNELRTLTQNILANQSKEITQMQKILTAL